jgi:hypothetical protein
MCVPTISAPACSAEPVGVMAEPSMARCQMDVRPVETVRPSTF